MGNLYILRHGNTFDKGDVVRRVGCRTDLPLSSSGQAQAAAVAEGFVASGITFGRMVCSPLVRTRQTAEAIAHAQRFEGNISPMAFLNEVDYGPDEGKPEDEVVARVGEAALRTWDTQNIPPAGWVVNADFIRHGWQTLMQEVAMDESANVLAVTSNGIARFVPELVKAGHAALPKNLKLATCCYAVIQCLADKTELTAWNN